MNGGTMEIDSPRPYSAVAGRPSEKPRHRSGGAQPRHATTTNSIPSLGLGSGVFFDKRDVRRRQARGRPAHIASWPAGARPTRRSRRSARRHRADRGSGTVDYMPGLSSDGEENRGCRGSATAISCQRWSRRTREAIAFYQAPRMANGASVSTRFRRSIAGRSAFPASRACGSSRAPRRAWAIPPAGYADGGSDTLPFSRRQRHDRPAAGARPGPGQPFPATVPKMSSPRASTMAGSTGRLRRCASGSPASCVRVRNIGDPAAPAGSRSPMSATAKCITVRGAVLRAGLLQHDDSLSLPGIAGRAERGAALRGQDAADLHQRGTAQLAGVQGAGRSPRLCAGLLSLVAVPQPGRGYRQVTARRVRRTSRSLVHMMRTPVPAGPDRTRAESGRACRHCWRHQFETFERNIRDQLGAHPRPRAASIPARDITAITVNRWPHGYAPEYNPLLDPEWPAGRQPQRNRPRAVRPDRDRQFRFRRRGLHRLRHRPGPPRGAGTSSTARRPRARAPSRRRRPSLRTDTAYQYRQATRICSASVLPSSGFSTTATPASAARPARAALRVTDGQDGRRQDVAAAKTGDQFHPGHIRRSLVDHQAVTDRNIAGTKKLGAAAVDTNRKALGLQREFQRVANLRIAFDNDDPRSRLP